MFEQEEKFFRFVESRNENTNFIIELIQNKTSFANRTAPVKKRFGSVAPDAVHFQNKYNVKARAGVSPRLSLEIICFIEEDNNGCFYPFPLE